MRNFIRGLLKSVPLMLVLALCVAVAAQAERLGIGSALVTLALAAALVFGSAMLWAAFVPWTRAEFIIALCPVPVVVLLIVARFSGFTGPELLHGFNLVWVTQVCLLLGVPWVAGSALGARMHMRRCAGIDQEL